MIKLIASFETFLINKNFHMVKQTTSESESKWVNGGIEIRVVDLCQKPEEYVVFVKKTNIDTGEMVFTSSSTIHTMEEIIHLEAFINGHLDSNPWLSRDK